MVAAKTAKEGTKAAASNVFSRLGEVLGEGFGDTAWKYGEKGLKAAMDPMKTLGSHSADWLQRGAAMGTLGAGVGLGVHAATGVAALPLQMAGVGNSDLSIGGAMSSAVTGGMAGFALGAGGFKRGATGIEARSGIQKLLNFAGDMRGPMSETQARAIGNPMKGSIKSLWEGSREVVSDGSYGALEAAKKAGQGVAEAKAGLNYQGMRGSGFLAKERAAEQAKYATHEDPLFKNIFQKGMNDKGVRSEIQDRKNWGRDAKRPDDAILPDAFYDKLNANKTVVEPQRIGKGDNKNFMGWFNATEQAPQAKPVSQELNKLIDQTKKAHPNMNKAINDEAMKAAEATKQRFNTQDLKGPAKAHAEFKLNSNKAVQHQTENSGVMSEANPKKNAFQNLIGKNILSGSNLGAVGAAGGLGMSLYQTNALGVYIPSNRGFR